MSEWLKEHAWKACVGETLPWVRIPLSPPVQYCCFLRNAAKSSRDNFSPPSPRLKAFSGACLEEFKNKQDRVTFSRDTRRYWRRFSVVLIATLHTAAPQSSD